MPVAFVHVAAVGSAAAAAAVPHVADLALEGAQLVLERLKLLLLARDCLAVSALVGDALAVAQSRQDGCIDGLLRRLGHRRHSHREQLVHFLLLLFRCVDAVRSPLVAFVAVVLVQLVLEVTPAVLVGLDPMFLEGLPRLARRILGPLLPECLTEDMSSVLLDLVKIPGRQRCIARVDLVILVEPSDDLVDVLEKFCETALVLEVHLRLSHVH